MSEPSLEQSPRVVMIAQGLGLAVFLGKERLLRLAVCSVLLSAVSRCVW